MKNSSPRLCQAAPALQRALDVLAPLRASESGRLILAHIEQRLQEYTAQQLIGRHLLTGTVATLLDSLAQHCEDEGARAALRIARLSLRANLSNGELKQLQRETKAIHQRLHDKASAPQEEDALDTLVQRVSTGAAPAPTLRPAEAKVQPQQAALETMVNEVSDPTPVYEAVDGHQHSRYQNYLDNTRSSMSHIQSQLTEQIIHTIRLNDELAEMLHSSVNTLCLTEWHDSTSEIRNDYMQQCNDLIKRQQDMATQFDYIRNQLKDISGNNEQLAMELADVYKLSFTDELTDLANRRALLQRLDDEIMRAHRYGTPLTFAIIDIDHFKSINDNFGHDVGDQVLSYYSKHILSIFRHHDIVARYGGEEFAALLPNTDIEGALCALNKVRMRAAQGICPGINRTPPTFSAGIALYHPGESSDGLIKRADIALYQAKENGRNRIEAHPQDVAQQHNTINPPSKISTVRGSHG